MASSSSSAASGGRRGPSKRDGTAKGTVADQIAQAVQSTSNLLHLMQQSSPSQAHLIKLPRNLLAKTSTISNTGQVLEQMPRVISSLDAHMENGLHRFLTCELLKSWESTIIGEITSSAVREFGTKKFIVGFLENSPSWTVPSLNQRAIVWDIFLSSSG